MAKLRLLEGFRQRESLDWDAARLQLIDLQWADVRPEKGLYHRLRRPRPGRAAGHRRARSPRAVHEPPDDTRAYFRGRCLAQYGEHVAAASWDSVIFDVPGRGALQRVPTLDPTRGTKEHVGALLDRCAHRRRPGRRAGRDGDRRGARAPAARCATRTATGAAGCARPPRIAGTRASTRRTAMAGQEHEPPAGAGRRGAEDAAPPPAARQAQAKDDDVDAILDEIDDVLESNAEEFVKGFVQKGGQ